MDVPTLQNFFWSNLSVTDSSNFWGIKSFFSFDKVADDFTFFSAGGVELFKDTLT